MQETEIPVVILVASLQFQKHNFIKFLNYHAQQTVTRYNERDSESFPE